MDDSTTNRSMALTLRPLDFTTLKLRGKKEPAIVRRALKMVARHPRPTLAEVKDEPVTRNERKQSAMWCLNEALTDLDRHINGWWMYRRTGDRDWKPAQTRKELLLKIEWAFRYAERWEQ